MRTFLLLFIINPFFIPDMAAQTQFNDAYYKWSFEIPKGWSLEINPFEEDELEGDFKNPPFGDFSLTPDAEPDEDGFPETLSEVTGWSIPVLDDDPAGMLEDEIEDVLEMLKDEAETVTVSKDAVTISGQEFVRIESFDQDNEYGFLNGIYLLRVMGDFVLRIEISYDRDEDKELLWEMISGSKFEK